MNKQEKVLSEIRKAQEQAKSLLLLASQRKQKKESKPSKSKKEIEKENARQALIDNIAKMQKNFQGILEIGQNRKQKNISQQIEKVFDDVTIQISKDQSVEILDTLADKKNPALNIKSNTGINEKVIDSHIYQESKSNDNQNDNQFDQKSINKNILNIEKIENNLVEKPNNTKNVIIVESENKPTEIISQDALNSVDNMPEWKKKLLGTHSKENSQKTVIKNEEIKEKNISEQVSKTLFLEKSSTPKTEIKVIENDPKKEINTDNKNYINEKIIGEKQDVMTEDEKLWYSMKNDVLMQELISVFLEEANELVTNLSDMFRKLKANDKSAIIPLKRSLHTLKGSSSMVNANALGKQVHKLETNFEKMESAISKNKNFNFLKTASELENDYLKIVKMIEWIEKPPQHLININEESLSNDGKMARNEKTSIQVTQVKVTSLFLDNLINQASEARLAVTNIFESNQLLNGYIGDLSDGINRLAKMLRELELHTEVQMQSRKVQVEEAGKEFDSLEFDRFDRLQELTRFIAEGFGDLLDIQQDFNRVLSEQEGILYTEERTVDDMQQNLVNTRLINFGSSSSRYSRTVQQSANDAGKNVKLMIYGENIELDRSLLEKINTPVEHLLRNSVAHGIETPAKRLQAGKPEQGLIEITLKQSEGGLFLEIKDDGAGVDLEKVRDKAIEKNLISVDDLLNENQIIDLIFMPGFSTAESVSQLAGRGVGMDVVKSDVLGIGGRLDTSSAKGKGLSVIIEFPASLSSMKSLLIQADNQVWGFPAKSLEEVMYFNEKDINDSYKNGIDYQGNKIKLYYFSHLAGFLNHEIEIKNYNHVAVFKEGNNLAAVHIPNLIGIKEVQVKPLGRAFTRINGLQGAFILPDGDVAYMVEPLRMLTDAIIKMTNSDTPKTTKKYIVLVVDDSLVIRKATSRFLNKEGFDVITAKNGEEGLEVIQNKIPDLILLDVEMPKMDGFEFTKHLREHNNPSYKNLPIIMITSRTADKHKEHAMSLGVNEYLGKPFKEEELLENIFKILK